MASGQEMFKRIWDFYTQKIDSNAVSALEYVEQVTYLLYLKMDYERAERTVNPVQTVPQRLSWPTIASTSGDALERQFREILDGLSGEPGAAGIVFHKAVPELHNPADLEFLIREVIAPINWSRTPSPVRADMYERLVTQAAANFNIRTGQTLTPRPFVSAVMDCIRLTHGDRVFDPAAGTGPFLIGAYEVLEGQGVKVQPGALAGMDLDERMCRLAIMNLLLRTNGSFSDSPVLEIADSLATPDHRQPSVLVCNPPFRSTAPQPVGRRDFVATTPIIQINFLQHIARTLAVNGRAAVFVPDNVLFAQGAAGAVREWLLKNYDVHTLLRLPTGVFERGGVKTNVLFFDRVPPHMDLTPATKKLWVYDFRTESDFASKQRPLRRRDLDDFVSCFLPGESRESREATKRFRAFDFAVLESRGFNLDITWREDSTATLGEPGEIAREIGTALAEATRDFTTLAENLGGGDGNRFRVIDTAAPVGDVVKMILEGELDPEELARALAREDNLGHVLAAFAATDEGMAASEVASLRRRREVVASLRELVSDPTVTEPKVQELIGSCYWLFGGNYVGVAERRSLTMLDQFDIPLLRADRTLHIVELKGPVIPGLVKPHRNHYIVGAEVHEAVSQAFNYLRALDEQGPTFETLFRRELGREYGMRRVFASVVIGHPCHTDIGEEMINDTIRSYNANLSRVEVITYKDLVDMSERALNFSEGTI